MFENHRKSRIQHCERSELRLHFESTKVHQKWSILANWSIFLKTWSLRSNSITRQVNFHWTKIGGKCKHCVISFSLKSALIFLILKRLRPCRKLRTVIFTSYAAVDMLKFIKTQSYKCTVVVQVLHLLGIISSQSRIFFAKGCRRRYGTILQNCYSIDNDIQNGWRRLTFPLLRRPCVTKTFANFLEYNLD